MPEGSFLNRNERAEAPEYGDPDGGGEALTRRLALAKLGIAATVVYTAPTILQLDRSANAQARPSPCRGGRRRKRCWPERDRKRKRRDGSSEDSDDD